MVWISKRLPHLLCYEARNRSKYSRWKWRCSARVSSNSYLWGQDVCLFARFGSILVGFRERLATLTFLGTSLLITACRRRPSRRTQSLSVPHCCTPHCVVIGENRLVESSSNCSSVFYRTTACLSIVCLPSSVVASMLMILLIAVCLMLALTEAWRPAAGVGWRRGCARQLWAINPEMEREAALSIDELKGELELRGVDHSDCLSRTDLIMCLIASRATGKVADADGVMDKFNQAASEPVDAEMFASEAVQDSVAGDGALPGGMDPAMIRMLSSDPEIMGFLKEPKFQAIMKVRLTLFDRLPSGCLLCFISLYDIICRIFSFLCTILMSLSFSPPLPQSPTVTPSNPPILHPLSRP